MSRSLSLSFSFMCAFLRQRKKERTKRCSLSFLSHKKRALKKTNAHVLLKCHLLSSDSLVEKSELVWQGVYFTEECASERAREREVNKSTRVFELPFFFFLARKSEKTYMCALSISVLTNYFVVLAASQKIFCKRRNKKVCYHRDTLV